MKTSFSGQNGHCGAGAAPSSEHQLEAEAFATHLRDVAARAGAAAVRSLDRVACAKAASVAADDCILLRAQQALREIPDCCAGSCYWADKDRSECLCSEIFPAIDALRARRSNTKGAQ